MGVDTKGIVLTKEKNPFAVYRTIRDALQAEMKRDSGKEYLMQVWDENYASPRADLTDIDGYFRVMFTYRGEKRDLSVFLGCDSDYSDFKKGKKIILSFGMWGSSVHLMEVIVRALTVYGKGWMCDSDSSEEWRSIK